MTTSHLITPKKEFLNFLEDFRNDLKNYPEKWQNKDLSSFLETMQAWIEDMDGFYENTNQHIPDNVSWEVFKDILCAASIYE